MRYIVYAEIIDGGIERWFDCYTRDKNEANEIALEMNAMRPRNTWYCVCGEDEIDALGVRNVRLR